MFSQSQQEKLLKLPTNTVDNFVGNMGESLKFNSCYTLTKAVHFMSYFSRVRYSRPPSAAEHPAQPLQHEQHPLVAKTSVALSQARPLRGYP